MITRRADGVRPEYHLLDHRSIPSMAPYSPQGQYPGRIYKEELGPFDTKEEAEEAKSEIKDPSYHFFQIIERDGRWFLRHSSLRKAIIENVVKKTAFFKKFFDIPYGTMAPSTEPYTTTYRQNYDYWPDGPEGGMWDPYGGYPIIRPKSSQPTVREFKNKQRAGEYYEKLIAEHPEAKIFREETTDGIKFTVFPK